MARITNKKYREFIDKGIISTFNYSELKVALSKVNGIYGKHIVEGRCLLIAFYHTGAPSAELLSLQGKHITRKDSYVVIEGKDGRQMYLPGRLKTVKELYNHAMKCFPTQYIFWHYRSNRERLVRSRAGEDKVYVVLSDKVHYHLTKWTRGVINDKGISAAFLQHNRSKKLSERGLNRGELMNCRGTKTSESVSKHLQFNVRKPRELARYMD